MIVFEDAVKASRSLKSAQSLKLFGHASRCCRMQFKLTYGKYLAAILVFINNKTGSSSVLCLQFYTKELATVGCSLDLLSREAVDQLAAAGGDSVTEANQEITDMGLAQSFDNGREGYSFRPVIAMLSLLWGNELRSQPGTRCRAIDTCANQLVRLHQTQHPLRLASVSAYLVDANGRQ